MGALPTTCSVVTTTGIGQVVSGMPACESGNFRGEKGMSVEHWNEMPPVPEMLAHGNTMF